MARRRKSFGDILDQAERIEANPLSNARRRARANIAADRYTDNIMATRRFREGGTGAYDMQFSRRVYMGLNEG